MTHLAARRLRELPTGIFSELANRKREVQLRGLDVIDLSVGSPDLPPPPVVRNALAEAVQDVNLYGYALSGTESFAVAAAAFYEKRYGVTLNPKTEVLQVMGSQDGLAHLAMSLLEPGDVVLAPDPGYPIYHASVHIAGGTLHTMPLREENGFLPKFDNIPQEILSKTKLMILNHPGNPVPTLATKEFFEEAIAFAKRHNIVIAHDFAYSELVFGIRPVSFLSVPGAKDVGIEFNSLSKTFNMAGARIGYVLGNADVLGALGLLKSHIDYGVFLPIQHAATAALLSDPALLDEQAHIYEARRDALVDGLATVGWKVDRPHATMFLWAKLPTGWGSHDFALSLISEAGVAVTPGYAFGKEGEGYVRIALVQSAERLAEAADRIGRFLKVRQ
ncbi:LL-diaminopimelate aminotransferase [Alicyclobacillus ferrooxydans]|uniref:Aminotransferase n=1 Tax=Alicyclobacillus ferrooxydans TaxID=471514 RepID=A0A0P9EQ10_9BACL|nr:LL-diaminopimelate aminotransferase [Alicyclobacillus ferrooxydans]KPV45600.1 aminotransferase [Alicyclobacillus ferrooxydans]